MAETTAQKITRITNQIAALKNALATGVFLVRHGDTTTQYRSVEEILKVIALLEAELGVLQGTSRRGPRYVRQQPEGDDSI